VTIFTTGERFTLDANVLVYAVDTKAGERHRLACEILDDSAAAGTCVLTLQALAEFFSVATRKGRMPIAQAIGQVRDLQAVFPVAAATPATLNDAVTALSEHGIAFWDAMLWACAREAGCTLLLSEDFQHGRVLEGVRFHNLFLDAPA
jgi:predicted nucleic acid-binding protein